MAQNGQALIATRELRKTFRLGHQWVRALNGVSVEIQAGQFVAIMGPSGSGKSTLLYLLGGLDTPTNGQITVAGRQLDRMNSNDLAHFRRETIGFVFQMFHLVPTMTALENVALAGIFAGVPREVREVRARKLLAMLGMSTHLDHKPSQLSGGQQQRTAIARSLFNNPPILMADEPTGALDSKNGQVVMKMLRQLCTQQHKTIVLVTHDPGVASYADRLLHLKDGLIVDDQIAASQETRA